MMMPRPPYRCSVRRGFARASAAVLTLVLAAACGDRILESTDDSREEILFLRITYPDAQNPNRPVHLPGWIAPDGTGLRTLDAPRFDNGRIAVAPDHRRVAYAEAGHLYTMNADGSAIHRLENPESVYAYSPRWSPDGASIAFTGSTVSSEGEQSFAIYVLPADGGEAVDVSTAAIASDGVCPQTGRTMLIDLGWATDGRVLFDNYVCSVGSHFYAAAPDGSAWERLTLDAYTTHWSPDGSRLLLAERGGDSVYLANADGSGRTLLTERRSVLPQRNLDAGNPWSPDGARFALRTVGEVAGEQRQLLSIFDAAGQLLTDIALPGSSSHLSWSPSGRRIVGMTIASGASEIVVADVESGSTHRLTASAEARTNPLWVITN